MIFHPEQRAVTIACASIESDLEWPDMDWTETSLTDSEYRTPWTLERASFKLLDAVTNMPMSLPAAFQFRWRSGRYSIAVHETGEHPLIHVRGIIGTVPFSCEDRSSRRRVLDTLRHLRDIWPCAGLTLAGGQVRLVRDIPAESPDMSFRDMVAQASAALLPIRPVIELIESDLWPAA